MRPTPQLSRALRRCFTSTQPKDVLQVCVVGSGPAGFYTAEKVLLSATNSISLGFFLKRTL